MSNHTLSEKNVSLYRYNPNTYLILSNDTSRAVPLYIFEQRVSLLPSLVTSGDHLDKASWLDILVSSGLSKADVLKECQSWAGWPGYTDWL